MPCTYLKNYRVGLMHCADSLDIILRFRGSAKRRIQRSTDPPNKPVEDVDVSKLQKSYLPCHNYAIYLRPLINEGQRALLHSCFTEVSPGSIWVGKNR